VNLPLGQRIDQEYQRTEGNEGSLVPEVHRYPCLNQVCSGQCPSEGSWKTTS